MKKQRSWWIANVVGICILVLVGCGDDGPSRVSDQVGQETPGPAGDEPTVGEPMTDDPRLALPPVELDLAGLSQADIDVVARGSYLVNAAGDCFGCHSTDAGYLGGGREFPLPFAGAKGFRSVFTRNLTPDPETGLQLTEDEFVEVIRTGKDFTDSTEMNPQRLIIMPWHIFRFMARDDLEAIYAYLKTIPPVQNMVRKTFIPPFPFPPLPFPAEFGEPDSATDPNNAERGLRIPEFFSSGPDADAFVAEFSATVASLTSKERTMVGRGSYLVNALSNCNGCHTAGEGGLTPGTMDVNTAEYLAGGVDIGTLFGIAPFFSRNLTPDPDTGLVMPEEKFIELLVSGSDSRRPGENLRVPPHFPPDFRHTLEDKQAIFAYLKAIPSIDNPVEIVP